jgi:hypothetical protein
MSLAIKWKCKIEYYWLIEIKTANDCQLLALLLFYLKFSIKNAAAKKKVCLPNYENPNVCPLLFVLFAYPSYLFSQLHAIMENKEYFVLDHATICADWYRLWSSFGFSEHQWSSRAAKVDEYTRVMIFISYLKSFYSIKYS